VCEGQLVGGAGSGKVKPGFWIRIRMLKFRMPYFHKKNQILFDFSITLNGF
jgi:hypothetical protein